MRKMLMGSALLALAMNCPAWAQSDMQSATPAAGSNAQTTTTQQTMHHVRHHRVMSQNNNGNNNGNVDQAQGDARPGHVPGVGDSEPSSTQASNIDRANTRSEIAPTLPSPMVGQNGSVEQYLQAASRDLDSHRTGAAQEALERAETRLLDRVSQNRTNPEQSPAIMNLNEARRDLANGDQQAARRAIQDTIQSAQNMQNQNMMQNGVAQNGMRNGVQNGMQNGMQNGQSAQMNGQMNGMPNNGMANGAPQGTMPGMNGTVGNGNGMTPSAVTGGQGVGAGMNGTSPNSPYPTNGMTRSNTMMSAPGNGTPANNAQSPMPMSNQP
jgi:hypothetical protein